MDAAFQTSLGKESSLFLHQISKSSSYESLPSMLPDIFTQISVLTIIDRLFEAYIDIKYHLISDSKSCLSGLDWPRSGKRVTLWHPTQWGMQVAVRSRCQCKKVNSHSGFSKCGWWGPLPLVQKVKPMQ